MEYYGVKVRPNPNSTSSNTFEGDEFLLSCGGIERPISYWIAQQIDRAKIDARTEKAQEIKRTLGI